MKRGRGKVKRQSAVASHEDPGSDEEEKIPASKRRGRPTKTPNDDILDEDEADKVEEDDDMLKDAIDVKQQAAIENGRKRKRAHAKDDDSVKGENDIRPEPTMNNDLTKTAGFRHNASRRKNKPRRAAEVGVECM